MNDFNRLMSLSGKNPQQEQLNQLTKDRDQLTESYNRSIQLIKNGQPLDEGIFSSLKIALGTAANFSKGSAGAVKKKIAAVSASVKELYKNSKAKAELQYLAKGLQKILNDFEQLSIKTPTIINGDAEIKKELMLFKGVFMSTRDSLAARAAIAEGVDRDDAALEFMLAEMNMHEDEPITEGVDSKFLDTIKDSAEFKEAAKRMKLVSTARQLKNGTLVFDTGMKAIGVNGKEEPGTAYLFKLYADGQVRAETKGTKNYFTGDPAPHYRLGKPLSANDVESLYKKMLLDVVKRFEKKSARYGKESEIIAKRFAEFQTALNAANGGPDAVEED